MSGFKPVDHRHDDALSRVSWDTFEHLVADHYRGLGIAAWEKKNAESMRILEKTTPSLP